MITAHSAPEDPEQQRQQHGDHHGRHDREVETETFPHDVDIAGQAAEREPGKPWPGEAGDEQEHAGEDEEALHGIVG